MCHRIINYSFIVADIIFPLAYSASFCCLHYYYDATSSLTPAEQAKKYTKALHFFVTTGYSRGILLLISALFLGDAIRRIKIAIKAVDASQKLNTKMFVAHLGVLWLYILSTFIYYVAFTWGTINPSTRAQLSMYRTWDMCTFANLLQQIFLMGLFWNFAKPESQSKES